MNSNQNDVLAILSEQYRHQVRVARTRMHWWWIPWQGICIMSFCISFPFIRAFLAEGLTLGAVVVFLLCAVVLWWMGWFGLCVIGFCVSMFGLITFIAGFLVRLSNID